MKNKGVMIALILLLVIVAIILISIMVIAIVNKDKEFKISFLAIGNKTKILFQQEYSINDIKNIEISDSSSNVKFVESNSDKINVTIYGLDKEEYNVNLSNEKLQIAKEHNQFYIFSFFVFVKQEVLVEIPKEYAGEIRNKTFKRKCRNDRFRKYKYSN